MTITTILPPARTTFLDANDSPLSGGQVFFYVPPNTTTLKDTWQDATATIPNDNPVILDGNGSALIYGTGQYLMELWDVNNNLIWTGLTQDLYGLITTSNNVWTGTDNFTRSVITVTTQSPGDNSTKAASTAYVDAAVAAIVIPSQLFAGAIITGFLPSNITGTSTTATILIAPGSCIDSTNTQILVHGTALPFSWAVSNGNSLNGFQGGNTLPNSTTIHFFVTSTPTYNPVTGSGIGYFASTSLVPTLPAGFVFYRRIFSIPTNSTGVLQPGTTVETDGGSMIFWMTTPILSANTPIASASRTLVSLNVPSGIKVQPFYRSDITWGANNNVILTSGDETDIAPTPTAGTNTFTTAPGTDMNTPSSGVNASARDGVLTTNTSASIGARGATGTPTLYLVTRGWKDFRRT